MIQRCCPRCYKLNNPVYLYCYYCYHPLFGAQLVDIRERAGSATNLEMSENFKSRE